MKEQKQKIDYPINQKNQQNGQMKQGTQLMEGRHLRILRNGQLIVLDMIYGIDLRYRSKYELFLHLVNTLNRNCSFPFEIRLIHENDIPISITYRYNYLIQQQPTLQSHRSEQEYTDQEGKNKTIDLYSIWQWMDNIYQSIMQRVRCSSIKESIYSKQYEFIQYLDSKSSQFEERFYFLVQELINQKLAEQKTKAFEINFTYEHNF